MKRKNKERVTGSDLFGFTLVELLIVTAMISVVSLAIYTTFNNGIKIWQRVNKQMPEEDLNIFFDKFTLDLRNSLRFSGFIFLGEENRLEFPTLINSPRLNKRTVGKVIYFYNPTSGVLSREQRDFAQIYSEEESLNQQSLINIKFLKFKYYIYDKEKKEYLWQDEWSKENMPLAVRIELELSDGTQSSDFAKTVSIPLGG